MGKTGNPARLLITGARGQIGSELVRLGRATGFEILPFGHADLDIGDHDAVSLAIDSNRPDAVINAAAYTAVDRAESEPDLAHAVNAAAPEVIARACSNASLPLLHISTDYVFDGIGTRPYLEDDPVAPQSVYGATKAAGEYAIRRVLEQHIILRTSWVFGAHGNNFVKTILRLSEDRSELAIVEDQRGCPTSAGDIASALLDIVRQIVVDSTTVPSDWGTYHFSNRGETTWCGFAQAIVERAAIRGGKIVPVRGLQTADYPTPARRPAYSVLDGGKIQSVFGICPRPWQDALDEVLDELTQPARRVEEQGQELGK